MTTKQKISVVIAALSLTLSSCYWHDWETLHPQPAVSTCMVVDTSTAISYSVDIAPIVASKCSSSGACHASGNNSSPVDFTVYTGPRGIGIAPACAGGLAGSTAWNDINGTGAHIMPVSGSPPVSSCEMLILRNWILHGARHN